MCVCVVQVSSGRAQNYWNILSQLSFSITKENKEKPKAGWRFHKGKEKEKNERAKFNKEDK